MKKYFLVIVLAFALLLGLNFVFFKWYYNVQVSQQRNLLLQQTGVCSNEIERVIQKFESDLNYILYSDDFTNLFQHENSEGLRKLQLFYSTYTDLVKNIDIYDNQKNVLNLFRDSKKNFITDSYLAQRQRELVLKDDVVMNNGEYQYVLPVYKNSEIFANLLVTINLKNYILSELGKFHLEGYTQQWVIDLEQKYFYNIGTEAYTNIGESDNIISNLNNDLEGLVIHKIQNEKNKQKLITVYAPIQLLNKKFGIAMSVDYKARIIKTLSGFSIISLISFLLFLFVCAILLFHIQSLKKKIV